MGAAEAIAFEEVRASKQWSTLRQQLHARFDQWLDTLEEQWHKLPSTLMEVTATVWDLRQQLTGGITETTVAHVRRSEHDRAQVTCPRCTGVLRARELVCRTVETMVGPVQLERPYFYCRPCHLGCYPLDEAAQAITNGWKYLNAHRGRTHYRQFRRGGYPLGSGGMESSNKFICHVRLKRSGAWWYGANSNQMLALHCAKYNGTLAQVFVRYQQRLRETSE